MKQKAIFKCLNPIMENGKSYKVLVSGAGGFVGSAVCSEFIADSAEVTAIGRTPPKDGKGGLYKMGLLKLKSPAARRLRRNSASCG